MLPESEMIKSGILEAFYFLREGSECMRVVTRQQLELLRKRYPAGTEVCLENMEGESRMPPGLKGKVVCVDDAGQIHVHWENGSSLALIPGVDRVRTVHRRKDGTPAEAVRRTGNLKSGMTR